MMTTTTRHRHFKKKLCAIVYNYFAILPDILSAVHNVGKVRCNLIDSNAVEEKAVNDC